MAGSFCRSYRPVGDGGGLSEPWSGCPGRTQAQGQALFLRKGRHLARPGMCREYPCAGSRAFQTLPIDFWGEDVTASESRPVASRRCACCSALPTHRSFPSHRWTGSDDRTGVRPSFLRCEYRSFAAEKMGAPAPAREKCQLRGKM